jgi:hypothetical protein
MARIKEPRATFKVIFHRLKPEWVSKWPNSLVTVRRGRVTAQAVSNRLVIAKAQVHFQGSSCGTCVGQSSTGTDHLKVLSFFPLSNVSMMLHIYSLTN